MGKEKVIVEVTKCDERQSWYSDSIGEAFEVYPYGSGDYVVSKDYDGAYLMWRHINKEDCIVIEPNIKILERVMEGLQSFWDGDKMETVFKYLQSEFNPKDVDKFKKWWDASEDPHEYHQLITSK